LNYDNAAGWRVGSHSLFVAADRWTVYFGAEQADSGDGPLLILHTAHRTSWIGLHMPSFLGFRAMRGGRDTAIGVSFWLQWTATGMGAFALFGKARRHLAISGHCPQCGYDLRATPDRCPECGATPAAKVTG
jgi:hypothetical protein